MELAVWWTTQGECEKIGDMLPETAPAYIAREYASRCGRSGRGRLWVPTHLDPLNPSVAWGTTPLFDHLGECGGVVIERADVAKLGELPGTITDMQGQRL